MVVILYYSFYKRLPLGNLGKGFTDLCMLFLVTTCESTFISKSLMKKLENHNYEYSILTCNINFYLCKKIKLISVGTL